MTLTHIAESRVVIPPGVLVRVINGEIFLLHIQSECYFGLNAVGARIFELLTISTSVGSAFEQTRQEFDVETETLQQDFDRLIEELLQKGLLEPAGTPST